MIENWKKVINGGCKPFQTHRSEHSILKQTLCKQEIFSISSVICLLPNLLVICDLFRANNYNLFNTGPSTATSWQIVHFFQQSIWANNRFLKPYEIACRQCQQQRFVIYEIGFARMNLAWGYTCIPQGTFCGIDEMAFFCKEVELLYMWETEYTWI